ncbi:uncharacterized protein iav isoform X2 [Venturia canescens]|uniref:uncharacterized protein iav isoform X2 n=1 Tax=Venturia canescens TaxID=32260 RepID=UPI001C9C808B|nr:uncharacterized protein LOC122412816 isoform X2 [Venturia canescens]
MGGVCSCRGRDSQVNAGSILDRVISQASNEDQCLLYRLANYKKGGELIEAYTKGGQPEVERLMREQFGILMYADGKGQSINRAEYLRWKYRDIDYVVLPIEASLSRFDPLAKWSDHEACWQMQYRGSLGETLLHVLIICDTRMHTRIARILLKCFPRLAIDVVEGEEYLGAGALHLAIAYANNELVQDLVEAGALVSQRATGSFFLPRDQQLQRSSRNTDYEGLAYLGEYPLAWAACCANESVYNLLLDSGADPDEQDSFGNMILHMVVVCDKLDMFGYALRHPKLPARNGIANNAGLTPLTLACQLGRAEVFREMLELSAREFWRYSNITCSAYPLNALDTLLPDGRTNWNSALFIILNGTKEEHLDMLDGGIIQRLLEEKWKTFARLQFLKRLIILVFHLTSLSLAVYLRPANVEADMLAWPEELVDVGRTIAESVTVIGVLSYILIQLGGEVVNIGLISFLKQLSHEPAKFIFLLSNILILACIPYRLVGDRHSEDAILVIAVPGSWFLLMFFAGPNIGELEMGASSGVAGGFGDALTAALDVMVFAHDIDLTTVTERIPTTDSAAKAAKSQQHQYDQTKVPSTTLIQPPAPKSSSTCLQTTPSENHDLARANVSRLTQDEKTRCQVYETSGNLINEKSQEPQQQMWKKSDIEDGSCKRMNGQVEPNQVLSSIDGAGSSSKRQTEIENPDPLLDLVIASESPSSQQATLLKMAAEAARISYEAVTTSKTSTIAANMTLQDSHILEKLTGLGAVIPDSMLPTPNPLITPAKKEKIYFVEFSDIEPCANDNYLGLEARLGRFRSASTRLSAAASKKRSRQSNNAMSRSDQETTSTTSTSSDEIENNPNRPSTKNGGDVESTKKVNLVEESSKLLDEESKKESTKKNGSETSVVLARENGCNERINKNHKRRPKTAKNRVSPKESNEWTERKKRDASVDGRSGSRRSDKAAKVEEEEKEGNDSPTSDPLEPWSTRDIKDMNAILPWRENGLDSP